MNVLKDWCFLSQYANCISLGVRVIAEKGFSASSLESNISNMKRNMHYSDLFCSIIKKSNKFIKNTWDIHTDTLLTLNHRINFNFLKSRKFFTKYNKEVSLTMGSTSCYFSCLWKYWFLNMYVIFKSY